MILACVLLTAPVTTAGSLLPFWIFINSLQIISHMILLKTIMPANAHFFLKRYNDLIRWYDPSFWEYLRQTHEFKEYEIENGPYSPPLKLGDYNHSFAQNMIIVIMVLLILLVLWVSIAIKDCYVASR